MLAYHLFPFGDQAITLEWQQEISPAIHASVLEARERIGQLQLLGILDLVPAYASLTVVYDPVTICRHYRSASAFQFLEQQLSALSPAAEKKAVVPVRQLEVPVCYHPFLAPDLQQLAAEKQISTDALAQLHSEPVYQVYLLGFLPGFAYMGILPEILFSTRKKTARLSVPAGSVGIAGYQTGIYPFASPGGWNLIGQTPVKLFDPAREEPSFFRPGDEVRFVPVSMAIFESFQKNHHS